MSRARLEISKTKCRQRYEAVRSKLSPTTKIMAVVKANAYGLGAFKMASLLAEYGVNYFSVATLQEGIDLRCSGISQPILVLAEPLFEDFSNSIAHNLCYSVYSLAFAEKLRAYVQSTSLKHPINVHIKVNTGLNRLGCSKELFQTIYRMFKSEVGIHLDGIYTHFANASLPDSTKTLLQIDRFKDCLSNLDDAPTRHISCHLANSDGVTYFPESHSDMVRVGLSLYKDTVSLKCRILNICHIPKGESVSYNSEFIAKDAMSVAIVSMGYADGVPTSLSNKGRVLIKNKFCSILGRVCMDMFCVDLSPHGGDCSIGDEVVVLGEQGDHCIFLDEIVELTGDNPREIMCRIGSRVTRSFVL